MKYLRLKKDIPHIKAGCVHEISWWYGYGRTRNFGDDWVEDREWFEEVQKDLYIIQEIGELANRIQEKTRELIK